MWHWWQGSHWHSADEGQQKKSAFARESMIKVSLPLLYWVMIIRRTHVPGSSLRYLKETKANFPRGGFLSLSARACGLFYICACVGRIYFHMLPGTAAKISQQLRGMCVCGGSGKENPLATLVNNGAQTAHWELYFLKVRMVGRACRYLGFRLPGCRSFNFYLAARCR